MPILALRADPSLAPSESEKRMAGLVHVFAVFFPWIAPFMGVVAAGESKYVRFHAWSSLVGEILASIVIGTIVLASLGHSIWNLYRQYQEGFRDFNIWAILVKSVVVWLGLWLFGMWNAIGSLISARKALRGNDWGGGGIADRVARKWAGVRIVSGSVVRR